jgi:hypothetical protein
MWREERGEGLRVGDEYDKEKTQENKIRGTVEEKKEDKEKNGKEEEKD